MRSFTSVKGMAACVFFIFYYSIKLVFAICFMLFIILWFLKISLVHEILGCVISKKGGGGDIVQRLDD